MRDDTSGPIKVKYLCKLFVRYDLVRDLDYCQNFATAIMISSIVFVCFFRGRRRECVENGLGLSKILLSICLRSDTFSRRSKLEYFAS